MEPTHQWSWLWVALCEWWRQVRHRVAQALMAQQKDLALLMLLFSPSVVSDSADPWTAALQAFLSFTISWSLLKLMSIESVMPSNHLILCRPLFLLLSVFPSIRAFSKELTLCIRWRKYWSFSFSISQDWFPLWWIGLISLQSKGLSRVFFSTTIQKHQFYGAQPFLYSSSHIHTWLLEKP